MQSQSIGGHPREEIALKEGRGCQKGMVRVIAGRVIISCLGEAEITPFLWHDRSNGKLPARVSSHTRRLTCLACENCKLLARGSMNIRSRLFSIFPAEYRSFNLTAASDQVYCTVSSLPPFPDRKSPRGGAFFTTTRKGCMIVCSCIRKSSLPEQRPIL